MCGVQGLQAYIATVELVGRLAGSSVSVQSLKCVDAQCGGACGWVCPEGLCTSGLVD